MFQFYLSKNFYWSIFLPWYLYFDLSKESLYFCHLWIWFVFISNVHKIRPFLFNIRVSAESYKSKWLHYFNFIGQEIFSSDFFPNKQTVKLNESSAVHVLKMFQVESIQLNIEIEPWPGVIVLIPWQLKY